MILLAVQVPIHLELRTKLFRLLAANEGACGCREGEMKVGRSLVAGRQATETGDLRPGTLDDPAMSSEVVAVLDAAAGDARHDASCPAFLPATAVIVGHIGVQFFRPPARATAAACPEARYRVEGFSQHAAVVAVDCRQS